MLFFTARLMVVSRGLPAGPDEPGIGAVLVAAAVIAIGISLVSWGLAPRLCRLCRRFRPTWGIDVPGADYPWDLRGAKYSRWDRGLAGTLVTLFTAAILLALAWFAFDVPATDGAWVFVGLSLVLAAGVLAFSVRALRPVGDALKWGTSRLLFRRFPFELGGSVDVRLPDVDALLGFTELTVTLRCVREEITLRGTFQELNVAVLRERTRTLAAGDVPVGEGDPAGVFKLVRRVDETTFLDLEFPLPDEDLGTVFSDGFTRYWELEVSADTPGLPFGATFLLPVYAPAAAG
jgi:hypothetical protein